MDVAAKVSAHLPNPVKFSALSKRYKHQHMTKGSQWKSNSLFTENAATQIRCLYFRWQKQPQSVEMKSWILSGTRIRAYPLGVSSCDRRECSSPPSMPDYVSPVLLSTDKAFIHSLMEYCSLLWAGSPTSLRAQPDAMETRAFKIKSLWDHFAIAAGRWSLCLLPPHFWSCTLCSFCALCHPGFCSAHTVHHQPPSGETT